MTVWTIIHYFDGSSKSSIESHNHDVWIFFLVLMDTSFAFFKFTMLFDLNLSLSKNYLPRRNPNYRDIHLNVSECICDEFISC